MNGRLRRLSMAQPWATGSDFYRSDYDSDIYYYLAGYGWSWCTRSSGALHLVASKTLRDFAPQIDNNKSNDLGIFMP
jgi:hypothetical protein